MRSNLLESFVFLSLMASGQAVLPLPYAKEGFSSRNNLADILPSKSEPVTGASSSTYECLYVSVDLPPCDFESVEDSEEDTKSSKEDYGAGGSTGTVGKERESARSRRDVREETDRQAVEGPARRHVIVYTIEGCLPSRLPFVMPSCQEKNSLDKIVEVRKFYPFTVKGLTKPPLVFPEFNFDRWMRMIKRLRARFPSTTNAGLNRSSVPKEDPSKTTESHRRSNALIDAPTSRTSAPKTSTANINVSKESPPAGFIVRDQKQSAESSGVTQKDRGRGNAYPGKFVPRKREFEGAQKARPWKRARIQQRSRNPGKDASEVRKSESTAEDASTGIPAVLHRRKPQMEIDRRSYRPIAFSGASNGLGTPGDADLLPILRRTAHDRRQLEVHEDPTATEIVRSVNDLVDGPPGSLEFRGTPRVARDRREIRRSEQIAQKVHAHGKNEAIGKSTVHSIRKTRGVGNSGLGGGRAAGRGRKNGTNKEGVFDMDKFDIKGEKKGQEGVESATPKSRVSPTSSRKNNRGRTSGVSRKGGMDRVSGGKKNGNRSKTSKNGRRSRRH